MPEQIAAWVLLPFVAGLVYYAGRLSARVDEHDRRLEKLDSHYIAILEQIGLLRADIARGQTP